MNAVAFNNRDDQREGLIKRADGDLLCVTPLRGPSPRKSAKSVIFFAGKWSLYVG